MRVVAVCIGTRLVAGDGPGARIGSHVPARLAVGTGTVFIFRAGVVVAFDVSAVELSELRKRLQASIHEPLVQEETEEATVLISPHAAEGVDANGNIVLHAATPERLEVVAHVLAKTTVLGLYERRVAGLFEQAEQTAQQLRDGRMPRGSTRLLGQIGDALIAEIGMVGRAEVTDKPEITWSDAELDGLYERLSSEFEISERDRILARKLALTTTIAERHLELRNSRRSLRVEWYIVLLIVFEIVLGLYDRFS